DFRRDALRHRARGHVVGDHGAGPGVRLVADLDGGDEDRVGRDAGVLPDLRAVLLPPAVVGGDRPGADVGAVADLGVADVPQVRDLCALAGVGVLDLDDGPDVGAGGEARPGPEEDVRPHGGVVADLALVGDGLAHDCALADNRVGEPGIGADDRAGADHRAAL